jgi:hypothetical protein
MYVRARIDEAATVDWKTPGTQSMEDYADMQPYKFSENIILIFHPNQKIYNQS